MVCPQKPNVDICMMPAMSRYGMVWHGTRPPTPRLHGTRVSGASSLAPPDERRPPCRAPAAGRGGVRRAVRPSAPWSGATGASAARCAPHGPALRGSGRPHHPHRPPTLTLHPTGPTGGRREGGCRRRGERWPTVFPPVQRRAVRCSIPRPRAISTRRATQVP